MRVQRRSCGPLTVDVLGVADADLAPAAAGIGVAVHLQIVDLARLSPAAGA